MKSGILTNIQEAYEELRYKTSWPTKKQVVKSALLVLIASIIIAAIVTYLMDMVANFVMTTLYNV